MEIFKVYKVTNHPTRGENVWEISNYGNVKLNGENYECGKNHNGYLIFSNNITVHRAVAELFIPNPLNKPFIDHIDTIRTNNNMENLKWCTAKENANNLLTLKHMSEGLKGKYVGEKNPNYGKHRSEETKRKIGEAHKGEKSYWFGKCGEKHPRAKLCAKLDPITNEVLEIKPCGRAFEKDGFDLKHISDCCLGKRKTHKGFKWKYID